MKLLKALIVEDSPMDEKLLLRQLANEDYDVQSIRVQTAPDMANALVEREWDIVLSDFQMPGFTGLDALRILKESGLDIPFIIISGTIGEEVAVEAMRGGINDYLLKGNLKRLSPAIERELDNAARRRAQKQTEEDLRLSEAGLANAQRIAHIGSWDNDLKKNQLQWSDEIYRIFGVSKADFGNTLESFISFIHPEDRQMVQLAADAAMAKIAPYNVEHRIIRPDGEVRVVNEIGEVIFDESEKPARFIGTVQDITERKLTEDALEKAMKRERAMIENSLDVICTIDAEGKFVSVSPASLKVWGYAPEELVGQPYIELVAPEDVAKTNEAALQLMSGVEARNFENCYLHKNGSRVEVNWTAFWSEKDNLMFCIAHDITERKAAETEMRLIKSAIDSIAEGIIISDALKPDNPIIYTNTAYEDLTGYTFEEIEGQNGRFLQGTETNQRTIDEIREALEKETSFRGEILNYHKNGAAFWNELSISPVFDESGRLTNFVGSQQNINERKRLEEERARLTIELASGKARLHHILDNSPSFVVTMRGPNFIFESVNPAYYQMVGQRELIGREAGEALPELMTQGLSEVLRQVYTSGEPFIGNEVPLILQSNDDKSLVQHYVNFVYMPLREADDSISGIVSYGVDVTEQVLSRNSIRESEERYRLLFENNPIPMWVFDSETLRFLSVNDAAMTHYGYSQKEFLTMSLQDIRLPEDIPDFLESVAKSIPGIRHVGIFRHRKKDGTIIYADIITKELIFEGRKAKMGLANDVTERRKAEESIRFQAHLLNTVEQSVIGTDLDGIVIYWNQFAEKLYGWTIAEAVGRDVRELITPEMNREQADQIMTQLSTGKSWSGEFIVRNKDGDSFPAYVSNSPLRDSDGKMTGIVGVSVDITERSRAEKALRAAEDKFRMLVESSPAFIYLAEPHEPFSPIYVSPNITRFGYTAEEWFDRPDMWISLIHDEDRARVLRATENAVAQGEETDMEYRIVAKDGAIVWLHDKGRFVLDEQGNKTGWQGMMIDITKTKELEEQLRQSQRLESVGMLAGGIAHDFNNMLTAINGYSDLTLRKLEQNDPLRRNVEEIKKAGARSADLTKQLLAFSRQQILKPIVINLNEVIADTTKMLQRLIGEDVQLATSLNSKIGLVKVDPGQFSQIIMNLAVNARDAMPQGGQLTIETTNIFLDSVYTRLHTDILPGAYVLLVVSDTGSGMPDKIKKHIFEPFFTTKNIGQGTGLGLSTVYGIVKQSGGSIEVSSEEGVGTTFKIYLPRVIAEIDSPAVSDTSAKMPVGNETILLVEDEEIVRNLSKMVLQECGYTVVEARNGLEALEIFENQEYEFDLLMTDVVMPQMGGRELAEKLATRLPNLQTLFTSGYTGDAVLRHGVIEDNTNFIQKPFTPESLANKIKDILNNSNKK